ncbi:MAG: hypothetical protein V7634_5043 [Bradyrhizobium sp.]
MEVMLEQSCRSLPRGGDQTLAPSSLTFWRKPRRAAGQAIGHLGIVARKALADYQLMP